MRRGTAKYEEITNNATCVYELYRKSIVEEWYEYCRLVTDETRLNKFLFYLLHFRVPVFPSVSSALLFLEVAQKSRAGRLCT